MQRTKQPHTNGYPLQERAARLQVLAALADRMKLARQMGESFEGKRNIYEALGYPAVLTYEDYVKRYRRQDIAKAVVSRPINATWQGGISLLESDDDKDTAFEMAWTELDNRLGLTQKFNRLDKLSCLGEYGVLLLGFDDTTRETWSEPVSDGPRQLKYIKPLGQGNAKIKTWDSDPSSERYGLPKLYDVTLQRPGSKDTYAITVHYSRVLHVAMDLLDDEVEGEPVLQAVFNRLMDLEKLVGGSAEMFWRGARPGYAGKTDPEYKLDAESEEKLMDQLDEYEHNLRRFLVAEGVDIQALASQISDPASHVDIQIQMISAMTGIPKRILTGSERGELASTQDQETWKELIQTRREELAEVLIVRPFVEKMIAHQVIPEYSDKYTVQWTDLYAPSEKDKADIGRVRTQSLKEYASEPGAEVMMPFPAFLEHFLGMSKEQVELIGEMREQALQDMVDEEEDDQTGPEVPEQPDIENEDQEPDNE